MGLAADTLTIPNPKSTVASRFNNQFVTVRVGRGSSKAYPDLNTKRSLPCCKRKVEEDFSSLRRDIAELNKNIVLLIAEAGKLIQGSKKTVDAAPATTPAEVLSEKCVESPRRKRWDIEGREKLYAMGRSTDAGWGLSERQGAANSS